MFYLTTVSYARMNCEMDFRRYPFDTQKCLFRMRTNRDISKQVVIWFYKKTRITQTKTSFIQEFITRIEQQYDNLYNAKFDVLLEPLHKTWYLSTNSRNNYSLSGFTAILARSSTPHLLNTFLPSGLLTVASFIGFLIPPEMVPGRMALLVTIFLMLVNIRSIEKRTGPVVSGITFWNKIWHLQSYPCLDEGCYSYGHLAIAVYDVCCLGHISVCSVTCHPI